MAVAALLAVACMSYLLLSSRQKETFFLTRYLGRKWFPKLGRDQRQERLTLITGTILSTILLGAFILFLFNGMARF